MRVQKQTLIFVVPRELNAENIVSSKNGAGAIGYPYTKKMNLDPYTAFTNINLKWAINLERAKTINS